MGNTTSRGSRTFLEAEPAWQEYYAAEWRSERSRELDRHGGLGRPPVARGDSITAKLVFLEGALKHEQKRMKQVLQVLDDDAQKREQQQVQRAPAERLPDFILNTDFRAYERRHTEEQLVETDGAGAQQQQKDFSLLAKDPELRKKMMEQRKKMLDYAKKVNVVKGAPGIKPLNLPAIKSKVAASWKPEEQNNHGEEEDGSVEGNVWRDCLQPAEWRVRMHQARRRLFLLVGAIARWQVALSRRPGPKRLPRVNSFSYFIPQVLGAEAKRFIEEANAIAKLNADAIKVEEPIVEPGLERVPPSDLSPLHLNRQHQQALGSLAETRDRGHRGRAPPRRGVSDSGCLATAAAAAAAVAAVDAESAAAAAADATTGARPKRKPELRKSSSGKCSSSSLPESLPGHSSDVEAYAPPRRMCSGRVASTCLPAISSARISSSGAIGGDVCSPPMAPRPPGGKMSRITSSGRYHHGGRARRQSDSSLALATAALAAGSQPAAIAAAAAVGGAVPPTAATGGATSVQRRASAVAAVRVGPGWRSRGSDCGSMQRRRECSEPNVGAAVAITGGGELVDASRPSVVGEMGSPRCSDAGQVLALTTAGSAPIPDSPSSFLPRISSSNSTSGGGAAGPGSSPSATKPMSGAQARRLALLAEAGALAGAEDVAMRGNAALSPSRLGPLLKLGNGTGSPLGSGTSRSPDKSSSGPGGSSILDTLRQSREGLPSTAAALVLPLSAGGMKELREAMNLANDRAPHSPINSPVTVPSSSSSNASSSGGGAPSSTISGTTSLTSAATTTTSSIGPDPAPAPSSGLPPLPPGKPPLGPAGSLERVRSGRSNNTSSASIPSPNPPPAPGMQLIATAPSSPLPTHPIILDTEAAARLAKAQQLMGMYANRVNATWAESQRWGPPSVLSIPEQELFCASDAWVPYKVTVLRMLKAGSLGVHIDACADAVQLSDGTSLDVWTSDPWNLAQRLRPGSLPLSERIEGISMGARVLQQLVLAVESLAGRDVVPKLTVVLAINDDQRNAVVADIIRTRAYGLKPENLILTAQRKRCGYRYDRDAQAFLEDPSTSVQVLGSGYALCQLAWLGDAFWVTREGELSMLMGRTLLERFAEQRVEWLVCRRARDLALLTPEGVLDLQHLAFSLYAADRHNGNMVVQAAPANSLTIPRAYDSTLLANKSPPGSAGAGGGSAATTRVASVAASAAGVQGGGGSAGVVDLRAAELSSPVMVEALAAVRKQAGHDGWVGLQRYLVHVATLHALLNTLGIFRPKLFMTGDVARLSLDAADITADRRVACVAVHTRSNTAILTSPNEVDDLIPLLLAQDHSAAFRDIIAASNETARDSVSAGSDSAGTAAAAASSGGAPAVVLMTTKPGIRILLFIASNDVTQLAVNLVMLMARPGRDVVHLVTVVHNSLQMPTGQALLLKYLKQISNAMIETHSEVLVKGINGLLEVMEGAAARLAPNLVVMASAALTMTNLNTASVMGSVTLSVLKRITVPVAVATSNSKNLVLTQRRTALRCMVLVDPTSRPALNFVCSSCMEPMRGDKLVLAGHHTTRQMTTQQQQAQRRLIDNFSDISSSHRFHTPTKLQLDGPIDKALTAAAEDEFVHLVGLQVPLGTKGVPGHVLGLIRACRGGVLVFRDTA